MKRRWKSARPSCSPAGKGADSKSSPARGHDRSAAHQSVNARSLFLEVVELPCDEPAFSRRFELRRIDEAAVDQHLVMQVRTRRHAALADEADELTLPHLGSDADVRPEAIHVTVGGVIAIGVAHAHIVAVLPLAVGFFNYSVAGRQDWRADGRRPIDAVVHPGYVEHRMHTFTKTGREAHGLATHRLAHKELFRVVTGLVIVIDDAVRGTKAPEAIDLST